MSCNCCDNPRTNEPCRKHSNHLLTLFCSNSNCMEPLCVNCLDEHKKIHSQLAYSSPVLIDLTEVEDYLTHTTKAEINLIEDTQSKIHKPAEAMYKCIDRFFYGSTERREKLLKERFHKMVTKFDAQLLVNSLEEDHEFSLTPGFKERYFSFLDDLMSDVASKNQVSQYVPVSKRQNK